MSNSILNQLSKFKPTTAVPSRTLRYFDYPSKIYPVSCTVVDVKDSYFDDDVDEDGNKLYNFYETIAGSRYYVTKAIKGNAGVMVNLNNLRPRGSIGSNGLVSQGVTNFMEAYSDINDEVKRGSVFKNGAVCLSIKWDNKDLIDFLNFPSSKIAYAKRLVYVDGDLFLRENRETLEAITEAYRVGKIFLAKERADKEGEDIFVNICVGIYIRSRGSCVLMHSNFGLVEHPEQIPQIMLDTFGDVDMVWNRFNNAWQQDNKQKYPVMGHFLNPELDKQVGCGYIGVANMLAYFGVTYKQLADIFELLLISDKPLPHPDEINNKTYKIAYYWYQGFQEVSKIAKERGYRRVHCVEPTATVSYRYKDLRGYTTTPEVSPPVCHPVTKKSRRVSETVTEVYQYPPDVEVAGIDVDWETHFSLNNSLQKIMNQTGLAHAISYNWWVDREVTVKSVKEWFNSALNSAYYRWQTSTINQDKTTFITNEDEVDESHWSFDEDIDENKEEIEGVQTQMCIIGCSSCEGE